jgi:hypothetical protein
MRLGFIIYYPFAWLNFEDSIKPIGNTGFLLSRPNLLLGETATKSVVNCSSV